MTDSWRCFLAVPLPDDLRAALSGSTEAWRSEPEGPDLRWIAPEAWHLTLAFLGSVPEPVVPGVVAAVRAALVDSPGWTTRTGSLGAFPGPRRARVLWYGVDDPHGRLAGLATLVRRTLEPMVPALAAESPFRAHVTLARARDPRGTDLSRWIAGRSAPVGSIHVDRVVLFRSHLGGGPARYEAVGTMPLPGTSGAMMDAETEASVDG